MKLVKRLCVVVSAAFICVSVFGVTLYLSHVRQEKHKRDFMTALAGSKDSLCPVIMAAQRSPFWVIPERKDVFWGEVRIGETKIRLFRPCRISVNGTWFAVSLELWTELYRLEKEKDGNGKN